MGKKYRIGEFAKRIGKSTKTIRRWDNSGRLPAKRTIAGQRYYEEEDIYKALGLDITSEDPKVIVYCRVSSKSQANDLRLQVDAMRQFCLGSGIAVDKWIEEFGSGLNFKRKGFISIIERIARREISKLIIAHKDRWCRFGFEFFEWFANQHNCKIIVVNQEQLSPHQEMVEDFMAIVDVFSCRLYGLRSYKKKIKEVAEQNG